MPELLSERPGLKINVENKYFQDPLLASYLKLLLVHEVKALDLYKANNQYYLHLTYRDNQSKP